MELVLKVAAVGITGSVLALLIQKHAPEMSLLLAVGIGLLCAGMTLRLASDILEVAELAVETSGLSPAIFSPVIKCVGIGLVTHLAGQFCRDAGQGSMASAVDLCGTFAAVYVSLPLLRSLLSLMGTLV
jgi:stage III sporulation protein AD